MKYFSSGREGHLAKKFWSKKECEKKNKKQKTFVGNRKGHIARDR